MGLLQEPTNRVADIINTVQHTVIVGIEADQLGFSGKHARQVNLFIAQ